MTSNARELAQIPSTPSGRRNLIINGAMNVCQRATSKSGLGANTDSGYHVQDRFDLVLAGSTAGRFTMSQDTDAPSGFGAAMKFDCTTADTSIAADEFFAILYQFEGQDLQQLAKGTSDAKEVTVSFYAKANASKTYVVELKDYDNTRTVSKTFTVGTSYSRIELTFPADTTGALDNDTARSFSLNIYLHVGSTYTSGTLQTTWGSQVTANRAVGCESFFSSTDNTFFITGLQMEIGSVATEFEHRSFSEELALCQRYYYAAETDASAVPLMGYGFAYSTTVADFNFLLPVTMRAAPSITALRIRISLGSGTAYDATLDYSAGYQSGQSTNVRFGFSATGLTAYRPYFIRNRVGTGQSYIRFDAEL